MWWCEWNQRNSWNWRVPEDSFTNMRSCNPAMLEFWHQETVSVPIKWKTWSNSYMWWIDHCLTYTFKSTTRYVDPTIWAQPELPHEQVIRAHGYPKIPVIPVISKTSSCFSVSQRLSRWELDAICHLFELRTLGVYELMTWTCWIDRLTMLKSPWI